MTAAQGEVMALPFTMITGGAMGLLAVGLAVAVIVQRVRLGIEAGDGGHPAMAQAVRAHANFTEHAPLALVLLAMLEFAGAPAVIVVLAGALLLVGRLLSAIGLSRSLGPSIPRQAGASLTILSVLLVSGALLNEVLDAP